MSLENQKERILLVSTTALGDTLLATPAIRAVKESCPETTVDMLVNVKIKNLLQHNPFINNLYSYRNNAFIRTYLLLILKNKRYKNIVILHANRDIFKLLIKLNYGQIVNAQTFSDSQLRIKRIDIPYTIHAAERRLKLVASIGAKTDKKSLDLFLTEKDHLVAEQLLPKHQGPLIGIHPGAAKPYKCWPLEHFSKTISYLNDKYDAKFIMTGHSKEKSLFTKLQHLTPHIPILFTGGLTINQASCIIKKLTLYITNDTGPMHIAFAAGTPTIAIFCPSDGETIGPYYPIGKSMVINKAPPCNPCITKKCQDPFCMKLITTSEVLEKANLILDQEFILS